MQNKMWPKTGLEANFFSFFSGLYSELPKILLLILFLYVAISRPFASFLMSIQACQLLLQQQQQPQQQQQQQQLLQNQRKFTPNTRQQTDPQQVYTHTHTLLSSCFVLFLFFTSTSSMIVLVFCYIISAGQDYGSAPAAEAGRGVKQQLQTIPLPPWWRRGS